MILKDHKVHHAGSSSTSLIRTSGRPGKHHEKYMNREQDYESLEVFKPRLIIGIEC
jgi:hypothetical protein